MPSDPGGGAKSIAVLGLQMRHALSGDEAACWDLFLAAKDCFYNLQSLRQAAKCVGGFTQRIDHRIQGHLRYATGWALVPVARPDSCFQHNTALSTVDTYRAEMGVGVGFAWSGWQ